jgi:hypothetical protein
VIIDLALHGVVRVLLRVLPFERAHSLAGRIGALFPVLLTREDARRSARSISRGGTCLSRSMTIAARAPSASVVIGVDPRVRAPLFAHAWVEMEGAPLDATEPAGSVIARLHGTGPAWRTMTRGCTSAKRSD